MSSGLEDSAVFEDDGKNVLLFYPFVPDGAYEEVLDTLKSRWIGQGPKVDALESDFSRRFLKDSSAVAVGSGTDALHLSYILAGIKAGDEVITPVFTCTATNIPLLYCGADIIFADIQPHSLNIDPNHVKELITPKTKAIVCVDYGGYPADLKELSEIAALNGIPLIEDSAQSLGATYRGQTVGNIADYTAFSFQAIKHITTGDGGMLTFKNSSRLMEAKRRRWFGIDREGKQNGTWENDIWEIGYKYQMTDLGASLGLASLREFDRIQKHRRILYEEYRARLSFVPGIQLVGCNEEDRVSAAWIFTILADNRIDLRRKLNENKIEANQVHFRNDRYSIFNSFKGHFPCMDEVESRYLVLPLHHMVSLEDVDRICEIIKSGW